MVRPEMVTVLPATISNTLVKAFPSIARLAAPGPMIVRLLLINSSPLAKVMVPVAVTQIVSPDAALAIVARSEPAPLSAVLLIVVVQTPKAWTALKTVNAISAASTCFIRRFDLKFINVLLLFLLERADIWAPECIAFLLHRRLGGNRLILGERSYGLSEVTTTIK
jgi:hypothetical protein